MKKLASATLAAVVLMAAPAFAQMADQPSQPGNMPDSGYHQSEMMTSGKITAVDLAQGTLTLDNGMEFTLAPSFQFTSFPVLGQDVAVTYDTQNGHNVARIIDVGGTKSNDSSD